MILTQINTFWLKDTQNLTDKICQFIHIKTLELSTVDFMKKIMYFI